MALTLRQYNIKLDVITKGGKQAQAGLRSLKGAINSLKGSGSGLVGTFAKITAGYLSFQGVVRGSKFIFETISGFDTLTATLRTLNGEIEGNNFPKATAEFAELRKIALDTPFTVEKVGKAFTQLKARGIDVKDIRGVMESVGNTAAAFGQDITSFANAVGQAIAGENERLKQFGISAKVQGKKVAFTYKGITKTVNKNIKEISSTLLSFGKKGAKGPFGGVFAGGAALQAKTLGGAFSRLKDLVQIFVFELGQAGLAKALVDLLEVIRGTSDEAFKFAKVLGKEAGTAVVNFTKWIVKLPERLKKLKKRLEEVIEILMRFTFTDNATEALNRFAAAIALVTGALAIGKLGGLVTGIAGAFTAIGVTTLGSALLIVAGIVAQVAILFFIIDDIITFFRGGESVLGKIVNKIKTANDGPFKEVRDLFELAKITWDELSFAVVNSPMWDILTGMLPEIVELFSAVGGVVKAVATVLFDGVVFALGSVLTSVRVILAVLRGDFGDAFDMLFERAKLFFSLIWKNVKGITSAVFELFGASIDVNAALGESTAKVISGNQFTDERLKPLGVSRSSKSGLDTAFRAASVASGLGNTVGGGGGSTTNSTTATINVNGAGDPAAVASETVKKLEEQQARTRRQDLASTKAVMGPER